jgi:hypothetical protein
LLIFSFAIFAWIGFVQAQQAKTVKLPSGKEVVDISGEWDDQIENYGLWSSYGKYPQVIKIETLPNKIPPFRFRKGYPIKASSWDGPLPTFPRFRKSSPLCH